MLEHPLRGNCHTNVIHRSGEPFELPVVELSKDALEAVLLDRLDLVERRDTARGDPDKDNSTIIRDPHPLDEALFLHPIDDPGGVAEGDVDQVRHPAHRELAMVLEDPQDVHVRHAHPELHEPARAGAAESRDDVVEPVDDPSDLRIRRGGVRRSRAVNSSHETNNLATGNHRVNIDHC